MFDQSSAEFGPNHPKERFWKKILRREKVNRSNNANIDKALEKKPKVTSPDALKSLQGWWYSNRGHNRELFDPYSDIQFYTSDSKLPSQCHDATALSVFLRKERLIPSQSTSLILPLDSEKVKSILPPYMKLSKIDIDKSHQVYLVSPSSKFLELIHFQEGTFLFRGERADTLDKATDIIIKRFQQGRIVAYGRSEVHTTPEVSAARAYASYGNANYSLVLIIRREAMDHHPTAIQNGGAVVLFPEISLKYLAGCITTSPEIEEAVRDKIKLPPNFFYTIPSPNSLSNPNELESLEQMDISLMNYIKGLETKPTQST